MREYFWNLFWTIVILIMTVLLGGFAFGLWDFFVVSNSLWTLFIIIPCLLGMYQFGLNIWNFFGLALGFLCLAASVGLLSYELVSRLIFPGLLIIIGSKILYKTVRRDKGSG